MVFVLYVVFSLLSPLFSHLATPVFAEEVPMVSTSTAEVALLPCQTAITPPIEAATSTATTPLPAEVTTSTLEAVTSTVSDLPLADIPPPGAVDPTLPASSTEVIAMPSVDEPMACEPQLLELLADPSGGAEWVRLGYATGTDATCLRGWSLSDGKKTTFVFSTTTLAAAEYASSSMKVFFPVPPRSLTNSGATLQLVDPSKQVFDQTVFPALKKDERWVRVASDDDYWERSSVLEKMLTAAATQTIVIQTATADAAPAASTGSSEIASEIVPSTEPAYASDEESLRLEADTGLEHDFATTDLAIASIEDVKQVKPTVKKEMVKPKTKVKATTKKKAAPKPKKTAAKAKTTPSKPPIPTYTFDMLPSVTDSIRVRLRGVVGSQAGLLAQQTFVLLNPDGRGLLIHANRAQSLPPMGTSIEVTGLLRFENEQLTMTMQKDDRWVKITPPKDVPQPRSVDLLAPGQEDAWALVSVTATVREVHSATVTVETDELSLTMKVRPVLRYRTARLKPGDVIKIQGLLDTRSDVAIYPRSTEEITILKAAKALPVVARTEAAPPWLPLGAAGAVVAFGQGWQEWRRRRETARLERRLAQSAMLFDTLPTQALARRESS